MFEQYIEKILKYEDQYTEISLQQLCLDVMRMYPKNICIIDDIHNEIKGSSNSLVKMFAILSILILRLKSSILQQNNKKIYNYREKIKLIEDKIVQMIDKN
tara:strand:- start:82 stop:384 length:303 start_codon:yes stop_codon:yes gene_type:complete